eukprot:TRINITY_DN12808_c0_g1_i1.p2 TRINITY_DN12808_c0_g1~~TRINITY_DN12808_c0_g1_i1.p2  ORF type:complete len:199 (+),score=36.06 TRINITY_DN12808_c0_g1_i1:1164-1760(+)
MLQSELDLVSRSSPASPNSGATGIHAVEASTNSAVAAGAGDRAAVAAAAAAAGWQTPESSMEPGDSSPQARHLWRAKRGSGRGHGCGGAGCGGVGGANGGYCVQEVAAPGEQWLPAGESQGHHLPHYPSGGDVASVGYHHGSGLSQAELNMLSQGSEAHTAGEIDGGFVGDGGAEPVSPMASYLRHAKKATRYGTPRD